MRAISFLSLSASLLGLVFLAGCGAPATSSGGLGLGSGVGGTTGGDLPGGGGGSIEVARNMAGTWSGTGYVETGVADLGSSSQHLVSLADAGGATMPTNLTPPEDGDFYVDMELYTVTTGVINGNYSDDNDNAGRIRGAVNTSDEVVLESVWVDGKITFTGTVSGVTYTGTYEVTTLSGAVQHAGTFNFVRSGDARDTGFLGFVLHEALTDDFDMVVLTPLGEEIHFSDPDYDDSVSTGNLPDILALPQERAPSGRYTIYIHLWSNNTGRPKNVILEAWNQNAFDQVLWSGTVPGNHPSGSNWTNPQNIVDRVTYQFTLP